MNLNGALLKRRWKTRDGDTPSGSVLPVPHAFLDLAPKLGLSFTDVVTLETIMRFKPGEAAPFPSLGAIARLMGTTRRTVRRSVERMEKAGYLKRIRNDGKPCEFDLDPLLRLVALHSNMR